MTSTGLLIILYLALIIILGIFLYHLFNIAHEIIKKYQVIIQLTLSDNFFSQFLMHHIVPLLYHLS
nr:Uncharacterised protein [Salmonella sp. NCTC 7297]